MFKKIPFNHEIFKTEQFINDQISFNLIPSLILNYKEYPDIQCYSDEKNVVLLNTDTTHPIITWTSDNFDNYSALYAFINQHFSNNAPLCLMTKNSVYQYIKSENLIENIEEKEVLGVYKCLHLNPIRYEGFLDSAKPEEISIIVKLLQCFDKEALPNENRPIDYYLREAEKFVTHTDVFKVWRDNNGDIVSIGRIQITDKYARLGRMYTILEKRGYSYAKMLVCELSKIAIQKGLIPILYTDFQYAPSNKCYQAVGFELIDTIYTYKIKKGKKD